MLWFSGCFGFKKSISPTFGAPLTYRASLADVLKFLEDDKKNAFHKRIEVVEEFPSSKSIWYEMVVMFKLLEKNPRVKELSLKECYTDPTTDKHIGERLAKNTTLDTFEISIGRMSTLSYIIESLIENTTLKTLKIHACEPKNPKMFRCTLSRNEFNIMGDVLKDNNSLKLIDLTHCYIDPCRIKELSEVYVGLKDHNPAPATLKYASNPAKFIYASNPATLKYSSNEILNIENAKNHLMTFDAENNHQQSSTKPGQ